ncbi:hypothetical protein SBRY_110190 [Actinacidiphila bryophytorum]|uniref:Uncharacterized protein n=1 Tax=Actinacidiphila bryophytorum TaxID=1436133 RepID=A0A9W4E400_9ACTN|nr:hypothetical protein SBRY_110190 [Actinacidiphila bryophytorum]
MRAADLHWPGGHHRLEDRPAPARIPADAPAPAGAGGRRLPGARDARRHPVRGAQDRVGGQHLHRLPDPRTARGAGPGQPRPPRARRAHVPPRRPARPHAPGVPGLRHRDRGRRGAGGAARRAAARGVRLRDGHEALRDLRPLPRLRGEGGRVLTAGPPRPPRRDGRVTTAGPVIRAAWS